MPRSDELQAFVVAAVQGLPDGPWRITRRARVGLLIDAAGWSTNDTAATLGLPLTTVDEDLAAARLEAAAHDHRCDVISAKELMRFRGTAVDHAQTCKACTDTRTALRTGRRSLAHYATARGPGPQEPPRHDQVVQGLQEGRPA